MCVCVCERERERDFSKGGSGEKKRVERYCYCEEGNGDGSLTFKGRVAVSEHFVELKRVLLDKIPDALVKHWGNSLEQLAVSLL